MIKIVKNVLTFCRDFLVGDDWTLLAVVIWSLASLSLIVNYYTALQAWYALPLGITGGLILSVRMQLLKVRRDRPSHPGARLHWLFNQTNKAIVGLWFPLAGTVLYAFFFEQSFAHQLGLESFLLPAAIELFGLVIVGALLSPFFFEFPLATSIVGVVLALLFAHRVQTPIINFAGKLSLPVAYFALAAFLALTLAVALASIWMLTGYTKTISKKA
jgi:hypothetical protein